MKKTGLIMAVALVAGMANANVVTINNLDVRGTGVYGHNSNVGVPGASQTNNVTYNGVSGAAPGTLVANPIDVAMTYSNLNLDGDATANDAVTFTLRFTGATSGQRAWGQGVDLGFGNLNGVTVSMLSVSGTTTDLGHNIVFDGFTGANAGMGVNGVFTNSVDINGATYTMTTTGGGFQFKTKGFSGAAPTSTLLFDNSVTTGGSLVARNYDLQFSTVIPEPATLGLVAVFGGGVLFIRRRFMI